MGTNMDGKDLDAIEAYPLDWPDKNAWPRNENPERSRFHTKAGGKTGNRPKTVEEARTELMGELDLLGANSIIISTNIKTRKDGMPYSNAAEPEDSGVAVYFMLDGNPRCIPCDKWDRVADNIYAIAKTVNALRGIDRWGTKQIIAAAFSGFKALPAKGVESSWYKVLDVDPDVSGEELKKAFAKRVKEAHPDKGGSTEEFTKVRNAYREAKKHIRLP